MPICRLSGEQIDWPGRGQEPVEEPFNAVPGLEADMAFGPDEVSAGTGAEMAAEDGSGDTLVEGEVATEGAAVEVEDAGPAAAAKPLGELIALEA